MAMQFPLVVKQTWRRQVMHVTARPEPIGSFPERILNEEWQMIGGTGVCPRV